MFSLLALLVALISGSPVIHGHGGHINIGWLMGAYIGGGATAGAIAAVMHPLVRWRMGAAVVGAMCAAPVMAAIAIGDSRQADWIGVCILSLIIGGPSGVIYRQIFYES